MTPALPHPGFAFLERASALLALVEAGDVDIETAIIELVESLERLVGSLRPRARCAGAERGCQHRAALTASDSAAGDEPARPSP